MPTTSHPDFDNLVSETAKLIKSSKQKNSLPISAFEDANKDDLCLFSAKMLADIADHAGSEIDSWSGKAPRVTVTSAKDMAMDGKETTILSITSVNKPFLYDSIMGEVNSDGQHIYLALHPILTRNDDQELALSRAGNKTQVHNRISHIHIQLPHLSASERADLKRRINHVLKQVARAVSDWRPMLDQLDHAIAGIKNLKETANTKIGRESIAFLNWLRDQNFTFLGMREFTYSKRGKNPELKYDGKNGLGILSDPKLQILRIGKTPVISTPEIIEFLNGKDHLIVTKANMRSVVHRRTYMDCIGIKQYDAKGNVCGELRIVGLFTSTAYTGSVEDIPLLRAKVEKIVGKFGYDPESHSGKSLLNVLEAYPRDELFQIDPTLLYEFCVQIADLEDRPRVKVLTRIDQFDRFVSVIVYVPRNQYNSDTREKIGNYLKAIYGDRVSAFYPDFPSNGLARVHFIIGRSGGVTPNIDQKLIEQDVKKIATRWEDIFSELAGKEASSLSLNHSFMEHFSPEEALADLKTLKFTAHSDEIRAIYLKRDAHLGNQLAIKIFHAKTPLNLSLRVPLLENLGFDVVSEQTHQVDVRDNQNDLETVIIHDMELELANDNRIDLDKEQARLVDAFSTIWRGDVEDDLYNRLVTTSDFTIREAKLFRAYARYLKQAGITYSQRYMADTLVKYPPITKSLLQLFMARFDPKISGKERINQQDALLKDIADQLENVPSLNDDKLIRRFSNVIMGTLRTNYFQIMENGEHNPILAFKLNSKALDELPDPVPFREIFVYGPDVEGVHLRFGPVARGGLRWSDRAEDYRTEVLGLVKAQQVKNAVIVPVGSKGGFYPKKLPTNGSRDDIFTAGREAYKSFISTMLSITDNLDGDKVLAPKNTTRHDGDDPYFVVAADKGTATFSDTANAISQDHHFWLDDAFASGGSAGYDHKKMGITAKGAWEAVKRHFREMNIDIQKEPFTVAGVGDMSGDVFGNGMLLSKKIRLVAAFDHRDIFIDPDPDCDIGFKERQRLFKLDRSSWQSYDKSLLSKGGMIISRNEKAVTLTKEVSNLLNIDGKSTSPQQIMTAILKADIDLLWFGGIGTYIRDETESDADVGDRANDPIRVIASEVGAKVIGEGANLGITQKARITYAAKGGRCNSDAIDNSAGVNSSDVEVNIKIALANAMREDRLTLKDRNKLLSSMTGNVSKLVLRNNYLQTLAISMIEQKGVAAGGELARLMSVLEADGHLNRTVETLPDEQALQDRLLSGQPLTRPEVGVLLSYAKIVLFDEIIASDLPDSAYFDETLSKYFPEKMMLDHEIDIKTHRLRREIISTLIINDTINRGGPAFISQMQDKSGASSINIVKSYILARDGLGFDAIYDAIDILDNKIAGSDQNLLYQIASQAHIKTTGWAIKTNAFSKDLTDSVSDLQDACEKLAPVMMSYVPNHILNQIATMEQKLLDLSVPKKLARRVAELRTRVLIPEISQISLETGADQLRTADTFFAITRILEIGKIQNAAENATTSDHYDILALSRSLDEISQARRVITAHTLAHFDENEQPADEWMGQHQTRIDQAGSQLRDILDSGETTASKLAIAAGIVADLSRS